MMKSAKDIARNNDSTMLDRPAIGSIFRDAKMGPGDIVILRICLQDTSKVRLVVHDDMVEALPPDRADHSFHVAVLPRRPRSNRSIADAHCAKPSPEDLAIGAVIIADKKGGSGVPRKGFGNLAGQPLRCRIGCDANP